MKEHTLRDLRDDWLGRKPTRTGRVNEPCQMRRDVAVEGCNRQRVLRGRHIDARDKHAAEPKPTSRHGRPTMMIDPSAPRSGSRALGAFGSSVNTESSTM